jgi:hypothetical protein
MHPSSGFAVIQKNDGIFSSRPFAPANRRVAVQDGAYTPTDNGRETASLRFHLPILRERAIAQFRPDALIGISTCQ